MADTNPSSVRRIVPVQPDSTLLREVISLGRENAKTLGFFPDGAFQDYASRGHLLACVHDQRVVGYLTFRRRHLTITLVHLCVASDFRQGGIARALIDHLAGESSGFAGIVARCRTDFPADAIWPHLGFTPRNEIPGRATRQPTTLRVWWRDFGLPDLFSTAPSDRIVAALDSNVLFDLRTDRSEPESDESKALLADWLGDSIKYVVTDEIFAEIARHPTPKARHALRAYADTFSILSDSDQALTRTLTTQLDAAIGSGESPQDRSDRRHLVLSVIGGAHFFVTRDKGLLDSAADIDASLGLAVLRPCDLIARTHAELTEQSFTPGRLSGSAFSIRPYRAADIDDLAQTFQAFGHHERKSAFVRILRDSLAQSTQFKGRIVVDQGGTLQGLLVVSSAAGEARIQLLRTAPGAVSDVLARHLVWLAVGEARRNGHGVTRLVDEYIPPATRSVLGALGFRPADQGMAKINGVGVMRTRELADSLRSADSIYVDPSWIRDTVRVLDRDQSRLPSQLAFECERVVWPAKLLDTALPSYIVPIRPDWAAQLFHVRLAEQSLFRSDPNLMLRLNNVYYRSSIPRRIEAPGRILWYVTASQERPSTRCVAATSLVEEVVRGPAKEVFSRFKRYGIFQWEDVLGLAGGDPHGLIEAFRFGHTEPFETPVDLGRVRSLVEQVGAEMPVLQSPSEVSSDLFSAIYREGFQSLA